MKKIIIAIDGPAGSGKSTSAKIVAEKLGYIYIDTGAMYRAITLAWIKSGTDLNAENFKKVTDDSIITLKQSKLGQRTILNEVDVSDEIRSNDVTKFVSPVSADGYVREKLVEQQRLMGVNGGVVMDGRDIGTVVFPQSELKIYLVASIEARTERRLQEMVAKKMNVNFEELKKMISYRDKYDSNREISPLKMADDAIQIDTSNLTIIEQTNMIIELAENIIKQ
jgi:cytidylate kinase